jgi:hypothetical protein
MTAPRLSLEALEDRLVPVNWGNPWPSPEQLTLSFVPDGTSIGGQPSNLFQTMNQQFPSGGWQREILRAFQTWADVADINLHVVPDGGQPLGSAGRPQGDPRFGDIRISAQPFTSEVYAFSVPFDPVAGTWSGDVRINSNVIFAGVPNAVDLYTVMLHEAGHAFGLSDSDDPTSVMYEFYEGAWPALGAVDVSGIQALYGARNPDPYEGTNGNETFATASPLTGVSNSDGVVSWRTTGAELTTPQDVDVYRLDAPARLSGMVLRLERTGLSLVTPRVTVYDCLMNPIATVASTDPLGGDLNIRLPLIIPTGTYYVKVEGAGGGAFDVGAYRLRAQTLPWFSGVTDFLPDPAPPPETTFDDNYTNESFATATVLTANTPQTALGFDYSLTARLRDPGDVDYYLVQAPDLTTGSRVITVMAWGAQNDGLQPRVQVFDANQNPVPGRMLVNENGILTFQVDVFVPGQAYFVKVDAASAGDYFLGLHFNALRITMDPLAQRSLTADRAQQTGILHNYRTGLYHFLLQGQGDANSQVVLTVLNSSGQVVAQLVASGGGTASVTLTLPPGDYCFLIAGSARDGGAFTGIDYQLQASLLSDPVGPQPEDPTEDPSTPFTWSPPDSP